ncbi:MAG: DUF1566 domain-containing protein [Chromatiaceae bacterium]|nr:DUF1566 domain-containing protein [Chromatiaceae bacterium]
MGGHGTAPTWPLNDTGIDWCANGTTNYLACPVAGWPGQDAQDGRDATQDNDADGHAGFTFTKLDANGNALAASASAWSCVRDNVTGLIWEVKTDDGGPRDQYWIYTWYNPDPATNGGSAGTPDSTNNCYDPARCDTAKFAVDVNQAGLCGASDWRLPNREELRSIVDNSSRYLPTIDTAWFPNTYSDWYWSSSPDANSTPVAWVVDFYFGTDGLNLKSEGRPVRLVRGGQALPFDPPPPTLEFDPIGSPQVEGQAFPVTITAYDAQGQLLPLTGAVQLYSQAVEVKPTSVPLTNGTWSGSVTAYGAAKGVTLEASAQGMTGTSEPFTVTGPGAESAYLKGKVTDLTDTPLAGATVYLQPDGGAAMETASDANGRYAFGPIPAGSYTLWAAHGDNPRRESQKMSPFLLSSYGPQTQDIEVNAYPGGIPVLLVPGVLGSTNKAIGAIPDLPKTYPAGEYLLRLHNPGDAVGWVALADELRACGFRVYTVPFDWRAPVKEVAEKYLKPAILRAKLDSDSDKVHIVSHSTGGLVARYYIQKMQERDSGGDIAKLAMVGTPHQGAVNAYYVWAGGDPKGADNLNNRGIDVGWWFDNFYWHSIEALYEDTYDLGNLDDDEYKTIYQFLRSAQAGSDRVGAELHDLLPTFDFLYYKDSGDWGLSSADNKNTTLLDLNVDPTRSVRMTKDGAGDTVRAAVFYSSSEDTIRRHETIDPVYESLHLPRYADGGPNARVGPQWASGDGTVLDFSARFPCDDGDGWAECHQVFYSEHAELVGAAKTQIRDFLAEGQVVCPAAAIHRATPATEVGELAVAVKGRVRPYLAAPDGAKSGVNPATGLLEEGIPGARVVLGAQDGGIGLTNPGSGLYQLSVGGAAEEEVTVNLSYLSAAQSHEKRVRLFHHGGTSGYSFFFDAAATEPLTLDHLPDPPVNARAEAVAGTGWLTSIAWEASPTPGVNGYRVYGRSADEPFMTLLGTTSGLMFDTGAPWAGEGGALLRFYAVSALLPDGRESFLTDFIENNDRDHDGLRDSDEAQLGTNPELPDTDADGLTDGKELSLGTNPLEADTDGDGAPDGEDPFPLDATKWEIFNLTVAMAGTGSGTVGGGGSYAPGDPVTLTATPDVGSTFAGWGPSPCAASFTMPATDLTCTATFSLPTLKINDVSKAEGNSGTTAYTFTVTLSPASTGTVTVKYATANGTATAGSDYTALPATLLTFSPGQTSQQVTVKVTGDTIPEANETFYVNLSAPSGATLFDGQGKGTLLNDEGPVLKINNVSKAEGNSGTTAYTFTVTLSPASTGTVTVKYATANGTATAGSDYTALPATLLTFSPGQTSQQVTVNVSGDTILEANETFYVNLSAAKGATLFDSQGLGTLLNDEGPVLKINNVSKAEGNSGTTAFTFTVTLSPASTDTVRVKYATANGTATAGSDYTALPATLLTFSPGQTNKQVTVNVSGDTTREANETFFVNLSAAKGATLYDGQGKGTLLNDDLGDVPNGVDFPDLEDVPDGETGAENVP